MSRAQRLLDLIQLLRGHRYPVSGGKLASDLGISLRTLYRDIATLQAQGATIDGAPGLGYILRPGFMLPPLMFSQDEIEALALGSRWVADRGDARLGQAAREAISKIAAVLPADLRNDLDDSALLVGPGGPIAAGDAELEAIRKAIRLERKLAITYLDLNQGHRNPAHGLALRRRLLRPRPGGGRMVRTASGVPALPHGSDHGPDTGRSTLSAPSPGTSQGMAGSRGHFSEVAPVRC